MNEGNAHIMVASLAASIELLITLASNIGLLALGAFGIHWVRGQFGWRDDGVFGSLIVGLTFGVLAAIVVSVPVTTPFGATFDTRGGPAILSGFFGGPIAGLVTATIGGTSRYLVGGPMAIGGALSFVLYAAAGIALRAFVFRGPISKLGLGQFLLIALLGTVATLPAFFVDLGFDAGASVLGRAWPILTVGNIAGVAILGIIYAKADTAVRAAETNRRNAMRSQLARASAKIGLFRYEVLTDRLEWDELQHQQYGVSVADFNGRLSDWLDRLHADDRKANQDAFFEAMRTNGIYSEQFRIKRGDTGEERWLQAYSQFVANDRGDIVEAFGVNWDITDETLAKQQLAAAHERTLMANERLEQFAYLASHDLQEPLRKIMIMSEQLEEAYRERDDEAFELTNKNVAKTVTRARKLVRDLQAYSRTQQLDLELTAVPLRDVIETAVANQAVQIEQTKADIQLECDLDNPIIEADWRYLDMVITKLLENALLYAKPDEPPTITMVVKAVSEQLVTLTVRDKGIGFDEKYIQYILKPFSRLHSNTQKPGSGVGLTICKTICEHHGWTLTVSSQVGRGSEFHISGIVRHSTVSPSTISVTSQAF